ncbi:hypothetical protein GCK32_012996 [Trichostrongylus colubriformis]|uniref:Uncharacterized protein n=1 Tax=Trichostrongylus colubriformis TaxID=6319 RepID=A0AAN8FSK7_TRICO
MLRWTAVILRFTMVVTCSAWNPNNVVDRWPRQPNYQTTVRFAARGLFTRPCGELRDIQVSTGYIPAPPDDEKNICKEEYESIVCRQRRSLAHDENWLEKTLKVYQMQAMEDHIWKTVQCLLSRLSELKNKLSGTGPLQHSSKLKALVQPSHQQPNTTVAGP